MKISRLHCLSINVRISWFFFFLDPALATFFSATPQAFLLVLVAQVHNDKPLAPGKVKIAHAKKKCAPQTDTNGEHSKLILHRPTTAQSEKNKYRAQLGVEV